MDPERVLLPADPPGADLHTSGGTGRKGPLTMKSKLSRMKALFVAVACGGIPLVTEVNCDPYGAYFFRDDDSDYYDDYYYDDYYYEDYYCDPYYCF